MKISILLAGDKLLELDQVALLMLAIVLIFVPATRTDALRTVFNLIISVELIAVVSRALRLGYGKNSPEELVEKLKGGSARVTKTNLERISIFSAMIATIVLALS